ncbi:uncharacterized protein [Lolium perenne]|uniref:uncharacterized protein isoform X2 n=1 Tax=Lolium perenne TaxID=4522 RepID=UPI0021F539A6|nr:uncharacterized protein LOC127298866 isoform X2 [Lolium perenne]
MCVRPRDRVLPPAAPDTNTSRDPPVARSRPTSTSPAFALSPTFSPDPPSGDLHNAAFALPWTIPTSFLSRCSRLSQLPKLTTFLCYLTTPVRRPTPLTIPISPSTTSILCSNLASPPVAVEVKLLHARMPNGENECPWPGEERKGARRLVSIAFDLLDIVFYEATRRSCGGGL